MASSGKTPGLELSQFNLSDKLQMADYNADMMKIESGTVKSVFGRAGSDISAQAGDYTPEMIGAQPAGNYPTTEWVNAQLSNKANELDVIQHTAAYKEPNDLHSVTKGLLAVGPAGAGAAMTKNAPPGIDWGTCLSLQYGATRQLIAIDSRGQVFAQGNDSRGWSPWQQLATAEPPREYFLPVSGATVGGIYYKKNQFDELTVTCSMLRSTLLHNTETIATLPIGYRPKHSYSCPCIFHAPYIAGSVSIEVSGEIKIGFESDSTNVRNISFAISNMGVL